MQFKNYSPNQGQLLPSNYGDFLGESHEAVILSEFIDELDTTDLVNSYDNLHGGSSAYHPVMLLKVLVYAYSTATFSSRNIAKTLKENLAFMYLSGNNTPEFRTIARFRSDKAEFLPNIFSQIVKKAHELELIAFENCSLDGTKIYANASTSSNYDKSQLEENIKDMIQKAADIDAMEDKLYGEDNEDDIDPQLKTKEGRKKRKEQIQKQKDKANDALNQISYSKGASSNPKRNTTDPDSRLMKMKKGDFANGYNLQNITENGFILSNYIDNSSADQKTLIPTLKKLIKEHQSPKNLLADKGYSTIKNYSYCEETNIDAYIPHTNISCDLNNYTYNKKDDTYTDNQGHVFAFKQHSKRIDGSKKKGRSNKSSDIHQEHAKYENTVYMNENILTGKKSYMQVNPKWNSQCEKQRKKLSTKSGKALYKLRMHDVEGVFGNIKRNLKFTYFRLRGFNGVETEWNLIGIAHNTRKLLKLTTT